MGTFFLTIYANVGGLTDLLIHQRQMDAEERPHGHAGQDLGVNLCRVWGDADASRLCRAEESFHLCPQPLPKALIAKLHMFIKVRHALASAHVLPGKDRGR